MAIPKEQIVKWLYDGVSPLELNRRVREANAPVCVGCGEKILQPCIKMCACCSPLTAPRCDACFEEHLTNGAQTLRLKHE